MLSNRTTAILAEEWLTAKSNEDRAKTDRIAAEEEIIASLGEKDEGAETHNTDEYKIIITSKITRKIDNLDAYHAIIDDLEDSNLNPITIEETFKVSDKLCRELRVKEPYLYAKLAYALNSKKAKTAIKIERKL